MDVDIDLADREELLKLLPHINAMKMGEKGPEKHISGVYFTKIPYNPLTNLATIDYKEAEERGYMKIDLLNMGLYRQVGSEEELNFLMNMEPNWDRLLDRGFCKKLAHIGDHFDIVKKLKPSSIEELAMVLAIIRPSKRHLLGEDWKTIEQEVWVKPEDGSYHFKKSHSIAYAHLVVLNMNLLEVLEE